MKTAEEIYKEKTGQDATYFSNPIDYPYDIEYRDDYVWWLEEQLEKSYNETAR